MYIYLHIYLLIFIEIMSFILFVSPTDMLFRKTLRERRLSLLKLGDASRASKGQFFKRSFLCTMGSVANTANFFNVNHHYGSFSTAPSTPLTEATKSSKGNP